jgi:hypothetical protein
MIARHFMPGAASLRLVRHIQLKFQRKTIAGKAFPALENWCRFLYKDCLIPRTREPI